jgi:chaperonin GroES
VALSRTATAALRQLIDAGTLSNLPAGFKARGLRIRDDEDPLQPGEFRDVDAPGGAIRDSLMPLPFKGPDSTLFQLLGFVVEAGQRFATITDLKVGDGNQGAAVGTTIAMLEQGTRVMSAVHKRMHYAMRQEFKLLARVMADYLPPEYPYAVVNANRDIKAKDFDDRVDILPVSNPNVFLRRNGSRWRKHRCSLLRRLQKCTTCMRRFGACMRRWEYGTLKSY